MLTRSIPDVEISAVQLFAKCFKHIHQMATESTVRAGKFEGTGSIQTAFYIHLFRH